ncbi:Kynurenine formamidase [Oryzisolibacter propanilivorax]|uniref:Kynurenine formamidase n=1 Tax=Oryzisolibacter propanilivorax TaxID=1527607 RepID=A0A1G9U0W3_9BURK|nr:arylformamidase [Oryzisolibacter propanilivorax]SDM53512.1 Kynurenine formamidase [Oryzisolibacter propanilivorax]
MTRSDDTPGLWDISPPVHAASPSYPGDAPYRQRWTARIGAGSVVNVSEISLSPHIGAHADAPLHYDPHGAAIGALALAPFIGPCRVVHAIDCGPRVQWRHVAHALAAPPPRVLVRTRVQAVVERWDEALSGLEPALVQRLADAGVQLLGIDSASIDPADSLELSSHQVVRQRGLRVLENLVLDAVPEGDYELIALPLKLMGADASPVRAILRTLR